MVRKKTGIQSLILILVWTIVGMYLVFEITEYNAKKEKWKYVEQLGDDWYYYRVTDSEGENSNLLKLIEEKYNSLPMSEVFASPSEEGAAEVESMKCYQYSSKAMEVFSYPIKEGQGFSNQYSDEVLVSEGVAKKHPVGSTILLHFRNQSGVIGSEVEQVPCKVVGIIAQEEIIFPEVSSTLEAKDDLGLFDDCATEKTGMMGQNVFILLNPALNISEKCKVPSSGLFFSCSKNEYEKMREDPNLKGEVMSCQDIISKNGTPEFFRPFRFAVRIMLSVVAIIALIVWIRGLNKRCKEEIAFLIYIGYSISKLAKRCTLFALPFLFFSYIGSFLGYFVPSDIGNVSAFWHFAIETPFILLGVQFLLFLIGGVIGYISWHVDTLLSRQEIKHRNYCQGTVLMKISVYQCTDVTTRERNGIGSSWRENKSL